MKDQLSILLWGRWFLLCSPSSVPGSLMGAGMGLEGSTVQVFPGRGGASWRAEHGRVCQMVLNTG